MRSVEVIASRFTSKCPGDRSLHPRRNSNPKARAPSNLLYLTLLSAGLGLGGFQQSSVSPSVTLTISTSEMLSRLSTWTSTPTGIAGPRKKNNRTQKLRKYKPDEIKFWHLRK